VPAFTVTVKNAAVRIELKGVGLLSVKFVLNECICSIFVIVVCNNTTMQLFS